MMHGVTNIKILKKLSVKLLRFLCQIFTTIFFPSTLVGRNLVYFWFCTTNYVSSSRLFLIFRDMLDGLILRPNLQTGYMYVEPLAPSAN